MTPASQQPEHLHPLLRWTLPTIADAIFVGVLWITLLGPRGKLLFLDGDPGWHIRAGEYMIDTLSIPRHDIFSHSMPGAWWVAYEWGAEVLFGLCHRWAGLNAVVLFVLLIISATYALLYVIIRRDGHSFTLSFLLLAFALAGSHFHWHARPHPISYLFVLVAQWLLSRYEEGALSRRRLWLLVPLMVAWVNLHAGFIAGIVIVLTHLGAVLLRRLFAAPAQAHSLRPLAAVSLATIAATLVNPNGYGLYVYLFRYFRAVHNLNPLSELHSPSFQVSAFWPFLIVVAASLPLALYSRYRLRADEVLTLTVWLSLGMISLRNIPVMFFVCAPIYARLLAGLREPLGESISRARRVAGLLNRAYVRIERVVSIEGELRGHLLPAAAILLAVAIVQNGGFVGGVHLLDFGFHEDQFPVKAIASLKTDLPRGNVFNEWILGGLLIYYFYPEVHVFVDGRMDMYGEEFTRQYRDLAWNPEAVGERKENWKAVFERYRIRWAAYDPQFALRYLMERDPDWKVIYRDQQCIVFVRREAETSARAN